MQVIKINNDCCEVISDFNLSETRFIEPHIDISNIRQHYYFVYDRKAHKRKEGRCANQGYSTKMNRVITNTYEKVKVYSDAYIFKFDFSNLSVASLDADDIDVIKEWYNERIK